MTAALEGGEWSAACPGRTYPQETPGTHFTGGWVDPTAGLEGRKISVAFKYVLEIVTVKGP